MKWTKFEDFFTNSQPCNAISETKKKLAEKKSLIDPRSLREQQDWSFLNGLIVGAEDE